VTVVVFGSPLPVSSSPQAPSQRHNKGRNVNRGSRESTRMDGKLAWVLIAVWPARADQVADAGRSRPA
jgi:hypothetical protein